MQDGNQNNQGNQNQNQGNQNQKGNQNQGSQQRETVRTEVTITVNREAIHASAVNARRLQDIALEVNAVSAKDLTIDSKIFGIETVPVDDSIKKQDITDNTAMTLAVKPIIVDSLARNVSEGCITVNGLYDIPFSGSRVVKPGQLYVASEEVAREICEVVTEVEFTKAMDRVEEAQKIADFLKKQLADRRW